MKKIVIFILIILISFSLKIKLTAYGSLYLPTRAGKGMPGTYQLKATVPSFYQRSGVKAMLYIPYFKAKRAGKSPLIIYFHGTTRNPYAFMRPWTMKHFAFLNQFTLLSVQNIWGLDTRNRDTARAVMDSMDAAVQITKKLIKLNLVSPNLVFSIGFSSGGFAALCSAIYRPDIFRGFASIKGNFYKDVAEIVLKQGKNVRQSLGLRNTRTVKNLSGFIALGGVRDSSRVRRQTSKAFLYLNRLNVKYMFKKYNNEGHYISRANFYGFWNMVRKIMNNKQPRYYNNEDETQRRNAEAVRQYKPYNYRR